MNPIRLLFFVPSTSLSSLWAVRLRQHLPNHMLSSAKGADHLNNGMQESTESKDQLLKPQGASA